MKTEHVRGANECLRDIVALSTLPAIWSGAEPLRIAEGLASSLFTTLNPQFVYVWVAQATEGVAVAQTGRYHTDPNLADEVGPKIRSWVQTRDPDELLTLSWNGQALHVAVRAVGHHAELGVIAVAFPAPRPFSEFDQIVLNVAATQAAVALENARLMRSIRDSEERYRRLMALLPVAVYTCDARSGVITYYNEQAARLWGRAPRVGDTDERFCGSHQMILPDGTVLPHDQCPMAVALREGQSYRGQEVSIRRPDGSIITILVNIDPILDNDGRVTGAINVFHDITDLKRAQRELAEQRRLYKSVTDNAATALFIMDDRQQCVFMNPAAEKLTGYTLAETRGRALHDVIHHTRPDGSRYPLCECPIDQAFPAQNQVQGEEVFVHRDGHFYDVAFTASPICDEDGRPVGTVVEIQDITQRKRAEQGLIDADRRKDMFLATLAHELRNPLAPLLSSLDLLDGHPAGATREPEVYATMRRQVSYLVRLVDDLLDISRITRDKLKLRRERVELASVVRQAMEAIRPHCQSRGHELVVDIPQEDIWLDADVTRLAQVIGNLLDNACKYTPRGGRIVLSARREDGVVRISVRDNGIGIAKEALSSIFEIFTQIQLTRSDLSGGGLGIGLSLVRRLVEMHGGTVEALSDGEGTGSEFVIRLPVATAPPASPVEQSSSPAQSATVGVAAEGAPCRILIVDDNKDAAISLSRLLTLHGNQTRTAYDGLAAIEAAEKFEPDIVLLDIGLPRMDGYQVCREIRLALSKRKPVMIALTGWGQAEDRQRSAEAGFDHHLVKPVDYEKLRRLLENLQAPT